MCACEWGKVINTSQKKYKYGLHTEAAVLSGITPSIKHEHKTRDRRPRVLCKCLMRGAIPDKTKVEVCNPLIFFTPDQPFVTCR